MYLSGWLALCIEITILFAWAVLKAAAVGIGGTMSSTGGDVLNGENPIANPITGNISASIDVREGTVSSRP